MPNIAIVGPTGFIGRTTLLQAQKNRYITRIFAITRTPLPSDLLTQPKVSQILVRGLESWSEETLWLLKEGEVRACVWCAGGPSSSFPDAATAEHVNTDLALLCARTFSEKLAPQPHKPFTSSQKTSPFRFIYLSITGAERNPAASLWTNAVDRKMKGQAERGLLDIATGNGAQGDFEVYLLRLGRVLPGGQTPGNILAQAYSTSVSVERVGRFCARVAVDGGFEGMGKKEEGGWVFENAEVLGEDWAEIDTLS